MNIGIVIVTYNRIDKLKVTLEQFSLQTRKPSYIMVVNNASSDGTKEYLNIWSEQLEGYRKIVLTMKENTGGSGGFYEGLSKSLDLDAEWIWVSDDDAVPELDAIEISYDFLEKCNHTNQISAICGQVINKGAIDINHRKNYIPKGINIKEYLIPEEEYQKDHFELNAFSYVGTIINRDKMKLVGITRKEYFIWWDDTEHSLRLSKVGKIICIPNIRIHHDVSEGKDTLSWKTYYGFRNMTDMYRRHMPWYCFAFFATKVLLKIIIYPVLKKELEKTKYLKDGFFDAINHNFGLHPVYRPGSKNK